MRLKWTRNVRAVLLFGLASVFSGCQEDSLKETSVCAQEVGLFAGGAQTRTEMLSDGLGTAWSPGDELAVWALDQSGNYTISNQRFKTYGIDSGRGFFTSTLSAPMPEGIYTYYCSYPVPISVNRNLAKFNIPSVQDGKVSGGADIMIATPVSHGPLTAIPEPEDHSGMSMEMNRMTHQFRFFIPENDTALGNEKITRLELSFPKGVCGTVMYDITNPAQTNGLMGSESFVTLNLARPIGVSSESTDAYDFACVAIAPVSFEAGQTLSVKAYTENCTATFDPIDLKGKTCKAGHSTPVKLKIKEIKEIAYRINFTMTGNNLGENPTSIKLVAPDGCIWPDTESNEYVYRPGGEITAGESFTVKFTELEAYRAFSNKDITVIFESDNAIMTVYTRTGTIPADAESHTTNLHAAVPYLFHEDFSGISDFSFDIVTGAQGTACTGYDLSIANTSKDNVNPGLRTGWTGARTGGQAGTSVRVGSRIDQVYGFTHTFGRIDSPALSNLKDGASVDIKVSFDYSGGRDGREEYSPRAVFGYTETTGPISGTSGSFSSDSDNWNDISEPQLIPTIDLSGSYTKVHQNMTCVISGCANTYRLSWQIRGTGSMTGIIQIGNGNQWMYIDNIKVQISK